MQFIERRRRFVVGEWGDCHNNNNVHTSYLYCDRGKIKPCILKVNILKNIKF